MRLTLVCPTHLTDMVSSDHTAIFFSCDDPVCTISAFGDGSFHTARVLDQPEAQFVCLRCLELAEINVAYEAFVGRELEEPTAERVRDILFTADELQEDLTFHAEADTVVNKGTAIITGFSGCPLFTVYNLANRFVMAKKKRALGFAPTVEDFLEYWSAGFPGLPIALARWQETQQLQNYRDFSQG